VQRIEAGSIVVTQAKLNRIISERVASVRARYGADLIDELNVALADAVAKIARLETQVANCAALALPAQTTRRP
jgi:hypothetical protein